MSLKYKPGVRTPVKGLDLGQGFGFEVENYAPNKIVVAVISAEVRTPLSHMMYLLISFRKSNPSHDRQVLVYFH